MLSVRTACAATVFLGLSLPALGQSGSPQPAAPLYPGYRSETPAKLEVSSSTFDYTRREAMIAMRDGVKLHTVILVPKGA